MLPEEQSATEAPEPQPELYLMSRNVLRPRGSVHQPASGETLSRAALPGNKMEGVQVAFAP